MSFFGVRFWRSFCFVRNISLTHRMSETQVVPDDPISVERLDQSLFQKTYTDESFTLTEYVKASPVNALGRSSLIEYKFPPTQGQNVYFPAHLLWQVELKLTTEDGLVPHDNANVAPVNNILHSILRSVEITVNNQVINVNDTLYPYR